MDGQLISDDELDALLTARDPLDPTRLNARQLEPALARLAQEISATSHLAPTPVRRSRVKRRLVTLAAVGVVVAAAALAGVNLLGGGSTKSLLPIVQLPAAQAAQLERIAQATAAGPSAGHGKWLYLKLTTTEHQGLGVLNSPVVFYSVTETVQEWSASASGPTRVRVTFSDFAFASAHARSVYESHRALFARALAPLPLSTGHTAVVDATIKRGVAVSPTDIGNGSDSKVPLSSLPTDPEALVKLLGRENLKGFHAKGTKQLTTAQRRHQQQFVKQFVTNNEAYGEWHGLSQILIASTSAQQRAEAYRALTLVRFVHVLGERRDSRGRLGTAVSFRIPGGSATATLIIDPQTGDLLQDNSGSGSVAVWLERAAVDSDTDLPDGDKQPAPRAGSAYSWLTILRALGGGLIR
jgi:hypothetical protein